VEILLVWAHLLYRTERGGSSFVEWKLLLEPRMPTSPTTVVHTDRTKLTLKLYMLCAVSVCAVHIRLSTEWRLIKSGASEEKGQSRG
jgi:hypothetical protein